MIDVMEWLRESDAILKGHFILSSGRHSDTYFEKFRLLENAQALSQVCKNIADHFRNQKIDFVAGPTTGGVIVAFEVARLLGKRAIYIEREGGKRVLRRGATLPPNASVLVVDDVLTTGLSIEEVIELLRDKGAEIAGVAVLVDRSESQVDFGVPYFAVTKVEATSYDPEQVPEWLKQIPISEPGSRRIENTNKP